MSNIYTALAERWVVYNEINKELLKIRAEIKDDMDDIATSSIYARDDFNNGVYEGLKMALKDIDKHIKGDAE